MKKQLLLLLLLSLFMTSSSYAYTIVANIRCGPILQMIEDNNSVVRTGITSWVQGYLTGRNYELDRSMKGKASDTDSIYFAIVKFCKENPLKDLDDAAIHIDSVLNK